ncbi:hypothetical protein LSCM1_06274 [Leishmania martiniquensis]|uniref:Uncharacterized protein n=1 Tax=Leishmania martiniquensis TaxID=1580590 RepID=A0A836HAH1_9TRYP|nr:hypothetical protein LSCM1_06274 [Leishmania martiniquensis]
MSSSCASQQVQQQQQQPWTLSAYHTVLTKFVSALQAEVRRQQDTYDHAVEILHASADAGPTNAMQKLGVPLFVTHEEQMQALRDTHALATLGTGALVALGPYRLLHTLKAHMTRIEDERRAGAVAAGSGIGAGKRRLGGDVLVLKSERSIGTTALEGGARSQTLRHHDMSSLPVRIKAERSDDDALDAVAQQWPSASDCSPPASPSPSSTDAMLAPMSAVAGHLCTKGVTPSSASGTGAGGLSDGCPPSWITLKREAETKPPSSDIYNGAYFVPHPTPAGAPIARYVSSPARSPSANNAASPPSAPLPVLVAPVNSMKKATSSTAKKRPAALPPRAHKRCRVASTSLTSAVAAGDAPLLSRAQRPKITRIQECAQLFDPAPSAPSLSREKKEGSLALQLWWRIWPSSSSASPSAPHVCLRPTPTIVAALIRVAKENYKRDCERGAAQQAYLAALLDTAVTQRTGSAAGGRAGARSAGQAALDTPPELPHPEALRQLQDELASRQAKLDSAYAERLALLGQLTEALQSESLACVGRAIASEVGEAGHAAPPSLPHVQHSAASSSGHRKKSRPSSSNGRPTCASTATDVEVAEDHLGAKLKAASQISAKNAAPGARALELLRSSLADPISLLRNISKARASLAFSSSETGPEAVTLRPRLQATSEESEDLPSDIICIDLPSLEHDRTAPELAEYLWPEDLDARIRHEMRGVVCATSDHTAAWSAHVVLSAAQVRRLEAAARAASTVNTASQLRAVVPPVVNGSIVVHPKFLASGWLYVHGRGETIVAAVELA